MKIFKEKPILYLHGFNEDIDYGKNGIIPSTLRDLGYNIDQPELSNDPKQGLIDFRNINLDRYSMVIGFSMGGIYASGIRDKKVILVNPGFGFSLKIPGFKKIEDLQVNNPKAIVLQGGSDKHFDLLYPEECKRYGKERIQIIPGMHHVPEKSEIIKYIEPLL